MMYQILIIAVPLISTPYISRALGVSNIGCNSYVTSIVNYFTLIAIFGTYTYGQREIGAHQNDKDAYSRIFLEILAFKILLGVLVSFAYAFVVYRYFKDFWLLFSIRFMFLLGAIVDISWFFQGLEMFKITVTRQIVIKLLGLALIFVLVKDENDLPMFVFIESVLTLLGNLSIYSYLGKYLSKKRIKSFAIFRHTKNICLLFIPQIATSLYSLVDKTMLGHFYKDGVEGGNYEQAYKMQMVGLYMVIALTNVLIPRLAFYHKEKERDKLERFLNEANSYVFFLGIPLAFGVSGIAYNFLPWFLGSGYSTACSVLHISAFLIFVMGLTNFWGYGYLVSTNQQKIYTVSVSLGTLINVVLNYFLIPGRGAIGAALASVLSEMCVLAVQLYAVRKQVNYSKLFCGKVRYLVFGFVMWLVVTCLSITLDATILNSVFIATVGMFCYLIPLLVIKDEYLMTKIKMIVKTKLI